MKNFIELNKKYQQILAKGFIQSVNNYKNGAGYTLENELGSTGGDFNVPDFLDIEIKTINKFTNSTIDLFSCAPDGYHFPASQWLAENFGYPDRDYKDIKVLKGEVYGNKKHHIGYIYEYKLHVDELKKRIELHIFKYNKLINNEIYWDFDSLKEKLIRKDNKLALFEFERKRINSINYYKYDSLIMYKLKSFEDFIKLINYGTIYVVFKVGVHKSGIYKGKLSDHGTSFRISIYDLEKLFNHVII